MACVVNIGTIMLLTLLNVSFCLGAVSLRKAEPYIKIVGSWRPDVTLVCTINPLVNVVTWKSSLFPEDLTNCDYQSNQCSHDIYRGYTFKADFFNAMYSMTIPQMNWEDSANYTCRQANGDSKTELFQIEAELLFSPPTIMENSETKTIELTTGCVYPELKVVLKWYILKADNSTEEYIPRNVTRSLSSSGCNGEAQFIQSSFTLIEPTPKLTKAVKFFAKVEHSLVGTTWTSDSTQNGYYIEEEKETADIPTDNCRHLIWEIFGKMCLVILVIALIVGILQIIRQKYFAKRPLDKSDKSKGSLTEYHYNNNNNNTTNC